MTKEDQHKIETVAEMLAGFKELDLKVKEAQAKAEAVTSSNQKDIIKVIKNKPISKFGERGAHLTLPKEFVDHYADIIISKRKRGEPQNK